ncbi:hypothetical protein JB92DRAFT_3042371, partial [Gautieria morchelliformis]
MHAPLEILRVMLDCFFVMGALVARGIGQRDAHPKAACKVPALVAAVFLGGRLRPPPRAMTPCTTDTSLVERYPHATLAAAFPDLPDTGIQWYLRRNSMTWQ